MKLSLADFDILARTENEHSFVFHEVNLAFGKINVSMNRLRTNLRKRSEENETAITHDTDISVGKPFTVVRVHTRADHWPTTLADSRGCSRSKPDRNFRKSRFFFFLCAQLNGLFRERVDGCNQEQLGRGERVTRLVPKPRRTLTDRGCFADLERKC